MITLAPAKSTERPAVSSAAVGPAHQLGPIAAEDQERVVDADAEPDQDQERPGVVRDGDHVGQQRDEPDGRPGRENRRDQGQARREDGPEHEEQDDERRQQPGGLRSGTLTALDLPDALSGELDLQAVGLVRFGDCHELLVRLGRRGTLLALERDRDQRESAVGRDRALFRGRRDDALDPVDRFQVGGQGRDVGVGVPAALVVEHDGDAVAGQVRSVLLEEVGDLLRLGAGQRDVTAVGVVVSDRLRRDGRPGEHGDPADECDPVVPPGEAGEPLHGRGGAPTSGGGRAGCRGRCRGVHAADRRGGRPAGSSAGRRQASRRPARSPRARPRSST
jgi:hypothetical protein